MSDTDELRGAYKALIDSPAGKDLLATMAAQELSLTVQAHNAQDHCHKASFLDEQKGIYWVRTHLADMSKPPVTGKVRSPGLK